MDHTIDLSIGFAAMRYVNPFSANLESRCPKLRHKRTSQPHDHIGSR